MRDRSSELGLKSDKTDVEMGSVGGEVSGSPTAEVTSAGSSNLMSDFFISVSEVKSKLSQLKRNTTLLEQKHSENLSTVSAEQSKQKHEELERIMKETEKLCQDIGKSLKQMDADNKKLISAVGKNSSEVRIRTNMHATLTKKFMDSAVTYQDLNTKYKSKYEDRFNRQTRIVNPNASDEDLERMRENPNQIFTDAILKQGHQEAQAALAEVQERHYDIIRLEQSIQELHQLFLDMSVLVETQGEMLDQIEYNIQQAETYTRAGVVELGKAQEYQKKSRKFMCCSIVILLIIAAILVYFFVLKK